MYKNILFFLFLLNCNFIFSQENIYLRDDFSSNKFNWKLEQTPDFSAKIENGNLNVENKTTSSQMVRFVQNMFMYNDSDFVIEAKLKFQKSVNEQIGGVIWHSLDENNGFYFEVSSLGKARVWANKNGGVFNLKEWEEFEELKNAEEFILKIDRKGIYMNLFVNNVLVYPSKYRGQFAYQLGFVIGKQSALSVDYLLVKHPKVDINDEKTAEKIAKDDLFWLLNDDVSFKAQILGDVKNLLDSQIIKQAKISLTDVDGNTLKFINKSSEQGHFSFDVDTKNQYILKVKAPNFITENIILDLNVEENDFKIEKSVFLNPVELGKTIRLENVFFERGEAILLRNSYKELDKLAEFMQENQKIEIELSGHTDNWGNAALNLQLSQDRVQKVKEYLVEKGINEARITGKGYGGTKPIADNNSELTRKLNRRVEFKIVKM